MKITMLGTSGSGKTVYMSAMSELYYNDSIDGYSLNSRELDYDNEVFVYESFNKINSLYRFGQFPNGTSKSTILPLTLSFKNENIIDIDWIDYRGKALEDLACGREEKDTMELYTTILASDVVMVFVDSTILKLCENNITARALIGANEITQILNMVKRVKNINIIFMLSKIDSNIIDINKDIDYLKLRLETIYNKFFNQNSLTLSDFTVIPVGAIGYGNVTTEYEWQGEESERKLLIQHKINKFENMKTINIASSFATALLKCLESETYNLSSDVEAIIDELTNSENTFGPMKNIIDILFHRSRTREHIFDLKVEILNNKDAIKNLNTHENALREISSKNI